MPPFPFRDDQPTNPDTGEQPGTAEGHDLPYANDDVDERTTAASELSVGQLVEHTFTDIPTDTEITQVGIVTDIDDDGVYVAPLGPAAVVPADQLRAR